MLDDFGIEIGSSFGPLRRQDLAHRHHGLQLPQAECAALGALEAVLRRNNVKLAAGAAVDAAYQVYESAKA